MPEQSIHKTKKDKEGSEMYELISRLYPYCRSITGNGVRKTLGTISKIIPIKISEVPSGKKVFDWEIPKEWNIKDAYIKDANGTKILEIENIFSVGVNGMNAAAKHIGNFSGRVTFRH